MPSGGRSRWRRAGRSAARLAGRDRLVAAAGLEAHVGAVAVEVLALAGEADHRVPELLVVLRARRERAVVDLRRRRSAARRCVTHFGDEVGLRQQLDGCASIDLREVARGRAAARATRPCSSVGPSSARVCAIHGNAASIVAAVSRTPGRISRAKARVFGNAALRLSSARVGALQRRAEQADRARAGSPPARPSRRPCVLKFVTRSCSCSSLRPRPSVVAAQAARSGATGRACSVPRSASVDDRACPCSARAP